MTSNSSCSSPSLRKEDSTSHHGSSKRSSSKHSMRIVQVVNIAPQVTGEQLHSLFSYVGQIEEMRLFPTLDMGIQPQSKICFIKFYDAYSVDSAQHLTNTVFIDRALIVIPFMGEIPDEAKALEMLVNSSLLPGVVDPKLPQHVTSHLDGLPPNQQVVTDDPRLKEMGLPPYPPLPPNLDSRKIEEIRRTLMICNIDLTSTADEIIDYFSRAGEVKYFRFCSRDNDPLRYALIEFSEQPSILQALRLNGVNLHGHVIRVFHSTQAIFKPHQPKSNAAAQKEIEEAVSKQTRNLLALSLDTPVKPKLRVLSRSSSRSLERRSRSRSLGRSRRRSRGSRSRRRSTSSSSYSRRTSRHRDPPGKVRRSPWRDDKRSRKSRSHSRTRRSSSRRKSRRSDSYSPGVSSSSRRSSRSYSRRSRSKSESRRRCKKHEDKKKSRKDKDKHRGKDKRKKKDGGENSEDENEESIGTKTKRKRRREKSHSPPSQSLSTKSSKQSRSSSVEATPTGR